MRTLLIDNYDSYTFNLFQLLGEVNGEAPVVVRNDDRPWAQLAREGFEAIVVSPGPGRPERPRDAGVSLDALTRGELPVLGVCLGHQALAYGFGGTVEHAPEPMHGRLSPVRHEGTGLFAGLPSPFQAVRYHSLAVGTVPDELRVSAWTADGVVMGLRHRTRPLWGVQFHPESISTEHGRRLLANFRDLARAHAPRASSRAAPRPAPPPPARPPRRAAVDVRHRALEGWCEPAAVFAAVYAGHDHVAWLDSARAGRFSYLATPDGPLGRVLRLRAGEGALDHCARELAALRADAPELPFAFVGGLAGYLGYGLKAECGGRAAHRSPLPDAGLLLADRVIAFDHAERRVHLVALTRAEDAGQADRWLAGMAARLRSLPTAAPLPPPPAGAGVPFALREDREAYLAAIAACRRQIHDGETYEVCLTTEITSPARLDPWLAYELLRKRNPNPHGALLRLGPGLSVLSSSPERFLSVGRDSSLESRPIKGTSARAEDPAQDASRAAALGADEKSRAENLMIADLVRNDLGRVCEIGSVEVPHLLEVETHPRVHQLVTTVRGRLREGLGAMDAVRAAFPAGSMTGAPKLRTMELLDELERRPRGVYSGALGYLSANGAADLSVVIRTLVLTGDGLSIGTGGAIVAQSDPEAEYEEMLLKARPLVEAAAAAGGGLPRWSPATAAA